MEVHQLLWSRRCPLLNTPQLSCQLYHHLFSASLAELNSQLTGSESELLYDWRFTANQFVLATSPLRLTTSNCIFRLNTYGYSPYVTSSLTRGWICRLQLLLVFASAVILRSESRGWPHLRFESPSTWRARSPHLYTPRTGWPGYTPRHRVKKSQVKVKFKVMLRRRSVGQSILVSITHLGLKTRFLFNVENVIIRGYKQMRP
jgi:hypothetical protein